MRDPMERLVVLPFSAGCVSESSIAVSIRRPRRSKLDRNLSLPGSREVEERLSRDNMKSSSFRLMDLPKPNISTGFRRMFKGFKSFSQIFVYKEGMEEVEMEMEIGFPTEVKHVTHIGLDGSSTSAMGCCWDDLIAPDLFSLPSVSMPTHHDATHFHCSS